MGYVFLTKIRCDFYFCTILPKLSEFRELRRVSVLAYLLQGMAEFRRRVYFLFIYDFSLNVQIKYVFTLEPSVCVGFLNTSVFGWCCKL